MTLITRGARRDAPVLANILFLAVRQGATRYTMPERHAWAPRPNNPVRFAKRLAGQTVWVARGSRGPVGFVSVRKDGYVDFAYLVPTAQKKGVFRKLMECAISASDGPMSTHASLQAQPAFAAMGFDIVYHEVVRQRGQRLRRAKMQRP